MKRPKSRRAIDNRFTSDNHRQTGRDAPRHFAPDSRRLRATSLRTQRANSRRPMISVFGSSRAVAGDGLFEEGLATGRLLGANGFDVTTGGYTGVMEAVSRGAAESGAHVVGVTLAHFEDRPNPYLMDEVRVRNFYVRFRWLIDHADGIIAMRGGMGTLAEMTFAWQKLSLRMFAERPLVLVGLEWRRVLDSWVENLTVTLDDYRDLTVVDSPQRAIGVLLEFFSRKQAAVPGRPVSPSPGSE